MKRILVTGATGFVGRHVTQVLGNKAEVFVIDRGSWDLTKPVTTDMRKKIGKIDCVIHLAGLTAKSKTDEGKEKAEEFLLQNVIGTLHVLDLSFEYFLFVSTADVYGDPLNVITEQTPVHPETAYAASKLAAEHMVCIFCTQRNIPFAVARLGNVYGPGEGVYGKAIPTFINQALAGKPLRVYGGGLARRDFIYVTDVARAIGDLARNKRTGTYNIASGISVSIKDVAREINRLTGNIAGFEHAGGGAVTTITFDTSKLTSAGFVPKISLTEGLGEEIRVCKSLLI